MVRDGGNGSAATRPNADASDHSLLKRIRSGNQDAANQLYVRYASRLHGLARAQMGPELTQRVDFDDIVQSVFGSFFRRVGRGYYDVPAEEELWRLFLVIALHKIRNQGEFHRAEKRDIRRTRAGPAGELALEQRAGDDEADQAFLELVVKESLEQLPAPQKQMVELRLQGYEVAEIATQTGRAKRTVERLLQDARKRLGEFLREDG